MAKKRAKQSRQRMNLSRIRREILNLMKKAMTQPIKTIAIMTQFKKSVQKMSRPAEKQMKMTSVKPNRCIRIFRESRVMMKRRISHLLENLMKMTMKRRRVQIFP